jgi:Tfp pilus assembly protein PilF
MAWTFLGVVYLQLGQAHLANKAFKEAQAQEPSYLRGWAGQALVAEVRIDQPIIFLTTYRQAS